MSKYSGKCDCYDWFYDKPDEYIANCRFYLNVNNRYHKLDIKSRKDLMPYYPYLIAAGYHDKDASVVHLSIQSYVDEEEAEHLGWYLRDAISEWKRCKRKKIEFNIDDVYEKLNCFHFKNDALKEIVTRVAKDHEKATIDGIHLSLQDHNRETLYNDMIEAGYDKDNAYRWVYGFERWFDAKREADKKEETRTGAES